MHRRTNYSSGTPWEPIVGYSRAVRVGDVIHVSGTTPQGLTEKLSALAMLIGKRWQTIHILKRPGAGGASLRMWCARDVFGEYERLGKKFGRAHGEAFGVIRPATSIVQVAKLISPEMLVEIEVRRLAP